MNAGWEHDLQVMKLECARRHPGLTGDEDAWRSALAVATGIGVAALAVAGTEQLTDEIVHVLAAHDDDAVIDALQRAAPSVDLAMLADLDGAELAGMSCLVRGALGEMVTLDLLVNGGLPRPPGVERVDLADFRQPGHDLELLGADGELVTLANVKVAASAAVVLRHLDQHPGVPVVYASSDAVDDLSDGLGVIRPGGSFPDDWAGEPIVIDIGQTSAELDEVVDVAIAGFGGLDLDLDDLLFELPAVVIGAALARLAWRWASTEAPAGELVGTAQTEIADGFTSRGAGLAVGSLTGIPVLRSLTSLSVSFSQRTVRSARTRMQMSAARIAKTGAALSAVERRRGLHRAL